MKYFKKSRCPICFNIVFPGSFVPNNVVCDSCYNLASDVNGKKLDFYNTSMGGGYKAVYSDTKEEYLSHTCYINGIECRANEHRMGGIEITVNNPWWRNEGNDSTKGFWYKIKRMLKK